MVIIRIWKDKCDSIEKFSRDKMESRKGTKANLDPKKLQEKEIIWQTNSHVRDTPTLFKLDGAWKRNKKTSRMNARIGWTLTIDNTKHTHSKPTIANSLLQFELQAIWSAIKEAQRLDRATTIWMDSSRATLSITDQYKAEKNIRCLVEDLKKCAYTLPSCWCVKVSRKSINEANRLAVREQKPP